MRVVALDVGSSSVKAAVLANGRVQGACATASFATRYSPNRAEVQPGDILRAISKALHELRPRLARIDMLTICAMAPSWLAMDKKGNPLTPVITHQDRRSIEIAREIENSVGQVRHLRLAGNRPFPGGISSTTAAWFVRNERALARKTDLVGHVNTFLLRRWTGQRVTDLSNASFTGLYNTLTLRGWNETLLGAAGVCRDWLPEVIPANQIAGYLSVAAARELWLPQGLPVLPGIMDTSAAILLGGAREGSLFNVSGSTDVLALTVDAPRPHERLLTRALGVGRKWLAVSTIASAGTTLGWLHQNLFADLSQIAFYRLVARLLDCPRSSVTFAPYLAGDRMSVEQKLASFDGLSLSTRREDLLQAAIDALARESAARIPLFTGIYGKMDRNVTVSGGVGRALASVLHRDWPGRWTFTHQPEAMLRGLATLAEISTSHVSRHK